MKNRINLVAEIGCNHKGDIKIAKNDRYFVQLL